MTPLRTIRTMLVSAIFRQFGICFGLVAIGTGLLLFVYICAVIRDPNIREEGLGSH